MKARKNKGGNLFKAIDKSNDKGIEFELDLKEDLTQLDAYEEFQVKVYESTGCVDPDLAIRNLSKVGYAITKDLSNTKEVVENMNRIAKSMAALEPKDDIEGQLVA